MPIPWRSGPDVFARILRQHAVDPDAVCDVDAAWDAFCAFLQVEVEGIEGPEHDGDGFIVEWGRWGWQDGDPSLSFGRQLAVTGPGDRGDPYWQPEYWKLALELVFAEDPAWADLDELGHQNTGFDFAEIGPRRVAALAETRGFLASYPQLVSLWRAVPARSSLTLEHVG